MNVTPTHFGIAVCVLAFSQCLIWIGYRFGRKIGREEGFASGVETCGDLQRDAMQKLQRAYYVEQMMARHPNRDVWN